MMSLLSTLVSFVIFCNMLLFQQTVLWTSEVIIGSPLIFVEEIRLPPCSATSCYKNGTLVIWPHELEITLSPRGLQPRSVRKVSSHFEYLENRSRGLGRQSEETLLHIREQSLSCRASQLAVRRPWLSLCTVWLSHSQWPSEQISESASMHLPILQLLCRLFWQNFTSPRSVITHTVKIWLPVISGFPQSWNRLWKWGDLWIRCSHSTQAQLTASHCRLIGPMGERLFMVAQ
jgi:hypothetical protein